MQSGFSSFHDTALLTPLLPRAPLCLQTFEILHSSWYFLCWPKGLLRCCPNSTAHFPEEWKAPKAPGNFWSIYGGYVPITPPPAATPHGLDMNPPHLPYTHIHTHTHAITPELYGTDTPYRRMLPWERGYGICSCFSSFLHRYFQNSVSLVISFLVSLFPWLHDESLWVLFSRSFSPELGGWMSIPILDSKSIVLIISFIYLQLNLRICLHKTPPCPRIYDPIPLSTPSAQVLLLSRAGVALSLSAYTSLCHLYSMPRCYFGFLCLCADRF